MKRNLLSIALAAATGFLPFSDANSFRGTTPSKRVREQPDHHADGMTVSAKEDDKPRSYPGAKLARKAHDGTLTKHHP